MKVPVWLALAGILTATSSVKAEPLTLGAPMGAAWTAVYGLPPAKPDVFVPQARALGAHFTRLTLYWSQLEPAPGARRWDELDAYLAQLGPGDEAILTLASSSPWATQVPGWVFPSSPAKDPKAYAAFIRAVVEHSRGKIRYFQTDPEPNNPFYWAGGVDAFALQQKLFYQSVKAADPQAMVVLGGCDGLFDPTGKDPLPRQDATEAFYKALIEKTAGSYDLFDLRLYANVYTIPDRVAWVRHEMEAHGGLRPIIATEYDGPGFFEFHANRRYAAMLTGPGAGPEAVKSLRQMSDLPADTRMFLPDASPELASRLFELASDDLVIRNLLAFSSGVQKTAFWDIWHQSDADTPNGLQYGQFRLLQRSASGDLVPGPMARPFSELASQLSDARSVERLEDPTQPDLYVVKIERAGGKPLFVAWLKPASVGAQPAPRTVTASWIPGNPSVSRLDGKKIAAPSGGVELSEHPLFIE
ncbi:MAG: hypothetical protein ACXU8O_05490 [Asticcacaulis sp.]